MFPPTYCTTVSSMALKRLETVQKYTKLITQDFLPVLGSLY